LVAKFLAINDNPLCPEIPIVFPVKNVCDGSWFALVGMAIEELLDFLRVLEEALQARDEREIAEKAPWASI
jgi:hypothetical protein